MNRFFVCLIAGVFLVSGALIAVPRIKAYRQKQAEIRYRQTVRSHIVNHYSEATAQTMPFEEQEAKYLKWSQERRSEQFREDALRRKTTSKKVWSTVVALLKGLVILLFVGTAMWILYWLICLPWTIAKRRGHWNWEAIRVTSYIALFVFVFGSPFYFLAPALGVLASPGLGLWMFALIWAYTSPRKVEFANVKMRGNGR